MTTNTPIQDLVHDRIGDNMSRGFDGTIPMHAVVDYLRLLCPAEEDLLLFSEQQRGATNTGRLFAVTRTHAAILEFGQSDDGPGRFAISGPILRLSSVAAVRFLADSTAWAEGHGTSIDPGISVEFDSGDSVTLGRGGVFGWWNRGQPDLEAEDRARTELLARLLA
ncbi:hypothetical protein ACTXPS_19910 [Brachybacterium tyrofermentans]|uniref:hypothetical protein n=1 Tax=Brachybacterium tyrofermentans TaxID=47848 RepID=UPI003FD66469